MSAPQRAGSLAALQNGKPLGVTVGGQKVAVFLVKGEVIATNGKCPHAGGMLHGGEVENNAISCPWHGWSYDLKTGVCAEDPTLMLEIYPVTVDGDDIMVTL